MLAFIITSVNTPQTAVRESFEYPVGSIIEGQGGTENGWGGSWFLINDTGTDFRDSLFVVSDTDFDYNSNIAYPIENAGNHIIGTSPEAWKYTRVLRPLASTWPNEAGREYWLSFAAGYSNWTNDMGWAFVSFYNMRDDTLREGPSVGMSWQPNVALGTFVDWSTWPPTPLVHEGISSYLYADSPYWLTVKIVMSGDTLSRAYLFVNPDPTGAAPDTSVADAKADWNLVDGLQYLGVHFGGDVGGQKFKVDELRLANSWEGLSTDVPVEENYPVDYSVSQNYPNPFNPSTIINYTVKQTGNIRLIVYDLLGREVATLVDGVQSAGEYKVNFKASNLTSGVYFYKLEAGDMVVTKKMMLLK